MTETALRAAEDAEIADLDARLAAAQQATRDAIDARARAVTASGLPFNPAGTRAAPAEAAALAAATDTEQALLLERLRLHERVNARRKETP